MSDSVDHRAFAKQSPKVSPERGVTASTAGGAWGEDESKQKTLPRTQTKLRWQKAVRKVIAVQALTSARDRWIKKHGEAGNEGTSPTKPRNTRKAKRQLYAEMFDTAGATIQKEKILRSLGASGRLSAASSKNSARKRSPMVPGVVVSPQPSPGFSDDEDLGPTKSELRRLGQTRMEMYKHYTSSRQLLLPPVEVQIAEVPFCTALGGKVWYWLEESFTKPRGKAIGLCLFALVQVIIGAFLLVATGLELSGDEASDIEFAESVWEAWSYVADPGTHAGESAWVRRMMAFLITLGGILLFAVVVGFVVDAIRSRLDDLKRGKSSVVEKDHYLILGWTDKTFSLIRELCLAMQSEGGGVIVILSERDKEEIEGEIHEQFSPKELCGTHVVCRTGSPQLVSDLHKVAASYARAIIILADKGADADKADASVLRTCLGLMGLRRPIKCHVVAELRDIDNEGLLQIIGKGMVETVVSHDLIGRLMLKCSRQPGLADAYEMFLGFEGDEFYLKAWPKLIGVGFRDLALFFPDAIPVGIKTADGEMLLNPPASYKLAEGDEVLMLAEDDDSYCAVYPPADVSYSPPPEAFQVPIPRPEKILFANARRDIDDMIDLLDRLVAAGSELHLMNTVPVAERMQLLEDGGLVVDQLRNLKLVHHVGNPSFRRHLERLPLESFTSVLVLADEHLEHDSMHSDSACLATLLLIRHIQENRLTVEQEQIQPKLLTPMWGASKSASLSRRNLQSPPLRSSSGHSWGSSVRSLKPVTSMPQIKAGVDSESDDDTARVKRLSDLASPAPVITANASATSMRDFGFSGLDAMETKGESESKAPPNPRKRQRRKSNSVLPEDMPSVESLVRDAQRSSPGHNLRIRVDDSNTDPVSSGVSLMACELLDARTRSVVQKNVAIASLSDYILSNAITSRVLAMIAERREVKGVLTELLGPEGQEVAVRAAARYASTGEALSFWELSLRIQVYDEILLGYKPATSQNIITNPADKSTPRVWSASDSVVVMTANCT